MDARYNSSVEQLQQESERTRAALAGTVVELREKVGDTAAELRTLVSPAHIKEEIKSYVREESENIVQSLERRARENPLQAAAVGAALAYPALGLLRAIPTPLLLIGAGLWLTSSRGRASMEQAKAKTLEVVDQGAQKASEIAATVKSDLLERSEKTRESLSNVSAAVSSNVGAVADKARAAVHDIRDSIGSGASAAIGRVTATVESASEAATRTASDVGERAAATGSKSRSAVMDFVEQNPLLVAGLGAAVGAFIAASLPTSSAENRLLGPSSDGLKDKVRDAAANGVEKAKDMAAEVVDEVATAAAREGIDAPGIKKAVDTVVEGVKSVADRGVQTALTGVAPANSEPLSFQQNNPRSQS